MTKMMSFLNFKFIIVMEKLYRALNHTRAINLINYVYYYERWNPLFHCCSKDGHNTGQNMGTTTCQIRISV